MKRLTMMMLLLLAVMSMQAQSLVGTWVTNTEVDEDGDRFTWYAIFQQDGKAALKMLMWSDIDMATLDFSFTIPGTYKRNGDQLVMTFDSKNTNFKIEKMKFKPETEKMLNENPGMREELNKQIKPIFDQIDQDMKKKFANELPFDGNLTIKMLTTNTLELDLDGETLLFKRVPEANQSDNGDTNVYEEVDEMPGFPGGTNGLMQFIATNLKYPLVCEENGIQGKVVVEFIVEKDGSVSNVKVVKSVNPALDKEAMRIAKSMPKWTPGRLNGELVRVKYTMPVSFRLQ